MKVDRRTILKGGLAIPLCGAGALQSLAEDDLDDVDLGVASGDPGADSVVIWTRLRRSMRDAGPVVRWDVATSEGFGAATIATGELAATSAHDFCLKTRVYGLEPATTYFYRFRNDVGFYSEVGRTRTLPEGMGFVRELKMGIVNCQQYTAGYYAAFRHMLAEDLDLVLHLGDHIYEKDSGSVRGGDPLLGREATTLEDYRKKYRRYLSDPDARALRARYPFIDIWDDHEVYNDYSGAVDRAANATRFAEGYQSFVDYMPFEAEVLRTPSGVPEVVLRRNAKVGDLVEIFALDQRQFRDAGPCSSNIFTSGCDARLGSERTMLGAAQKLWLKESLGASRATWKILMSEVMVTPLRIRGAAVASERAARVLFEAGATYETRSGTFMTLDTWDGYPVERQELAAFIRDEGIANVVICTGDIHAALNARIPLEVETHRGPGVAFEVVTTSVSTSTLADRLGPVLGGAAHAIIRGANPQYQWSDIAHHGYTTLTLTPEAMRVKHVALDHVNSSTAGARVVREVSIPAGTILER